jgi:hypothetical protein
VDAAGIQSSGLKKNNAVCCILYSFLLGFPQGQVDSYFNPLNDRFLL